MLFKDQADSAAQRLLSEKLSAQHNTTRELSAARHATRKWMPLGALLGLALGWIARDLALFPAFPAAAFGLGLCAVLGAFLDRRRKQS